MNLRFSRKAVLRAVAVASVLLLGWLATSQGPLAPTRVTLAKVQQGPLLESTFGIGTVEARRSYALGPTTASRVARVLVILFRRAKHQKEPMAHIVWYPSAKLHRGLHKAVHILIHKRKDRRGPHPL